MSLFHTKKTHNSNCNVFLRRLNTHNNVIFKIFLSSINEKTTNEINITKGNVRVKTYFSNISPKLIVI